MKNILFKLEMIRAIIDGRKTQTRRIHKDMRKPRYNVGEVVYIGESYCLPGACVAPIRYRADEYDGCKCCDLPRWQNAMFMPEKYARVFLKITGVKKQLFSKVTEVEARAEGFENSATFFGYFLRINKYPIVPPDMEVWAYTFEVVKK